MFLQLIVLLHCFFLPFCVNASSGNQGDGLDAVRKFVASPEFEQYRLRVKQGEVVIPSELEKQKCSTQLWQGVMDDVCKEKAEKQYLEKKQKAQAGLASHGLRLESDSEDEDPLQGLDISFLNEEFHRKFELKFDQNIKTAVLEPRDYNSYLTAIAYKTMSDLKVNPRLYKVVWNAIKIQSYSAKDAFNSNVSTTAAVPASSAYKMNPNESKKQTLKSKKLTPKQKAKDAADHDYLDEQIRIARQQKELMIDPLLKNNTKEFNGFGSARLAGKASRVTSEGYFRTHDDSIIGLLAFVDKCSNRSVDDLVKSSEFHNQIDKYLYDMGVPKASRARFKSGLISQLEDSSK